MTGGIIKAGVLHFGSTAMSVDDCFIFIPGGGLPEYKVLVIRAKESNVPRKAMEALKDNRDSIYFFQGGKLAATYEGYHAAFQCRCTGGEYLLELLRLPEKPEPIQREEKKSLWTRLIKRLLLGKGGDYH